MDQTTTDIPAINYDSVPYLVRDDLVAAQNTAWKQLSEPGAWLDARKRLDVARETRKAWDCALCASRKVALSPYAIVGDHDNVTDLSPAEIEIIHRIATDPGRLREKWLKGEMEAGDISEEAYIEIVTIICKIIMIDRFAESLSESEYSLPAPVPGEPSGYRAPGAKMHDGWISLVEPKDAVPEDGILYVSEASAAGVVKALSLVPDAWREYWALGDAHYIHHEDVFNFDLDLREITRAQIEVVAARVSAVHQCVY